MEYAKKRKEMVERQLKARDITDSKVIKAMLDLPRHEFVPPSMRESAYEDYPLPIGEGQTISQPYIVALMTQELGLKGGEKVLEIGTGSGYQAAVLSRIAKDVYTVERIAKHAAQAESIIKRLGYRNVHILVGDGSKGWKEHAPYDAIITTAAADKAPDALKQQLKEGGRLVIPLDRDWAQELVRITKRKGKFTEKDICGCMFVPLIKGK